MKKFVLFLIVVGMSWVGVYYLYQSSISTEVEVMVNYQTITDNFIQALDGEARFEMVASSPFLARCDGVLLGDPEFLEEPIIGTDFDYQQTAVCRQLYFETGNPVVRATSRLLVTDRNVSLERGLSVLLAVFILVLWGILFFSVRKS